MFKLSYNSIEHIALYEADKYFNLTSAQKESFKKNIIEKREHHRRVFLPRYLTAAERFSLAFQKGVTSDDLNYLSAFIKREAGALAALLAPDLASLLASLSEDQITGFRKQLEKFNSDERKKFPADRNLRFEKRLEALIKSYEMIYGKLSHNQKEIIRTRYKIFPDITEERFPYLQRTQKTFISLLEEKSESEISSFLVKWMTRDESLMSQRHRWLLTEHKNKADSLFVYFDSSMASSEQRAFAVDFTDETADMIKNLGNMKKSMPRVPGAFRAPFPYMLCYFPAESATAFEAESAHFIMELFTAASFASPTGGTQPQLSWHIGHHAVLNEWLCPHNSNQLPRP